MSSTSAKMVVEAKRRNNHPVDKETFAPTPELDLSIFKAKEIRDILKSKAHCLQAGFSPNHAIIVTLNEIRNHYLLKVGLPTYLSQMLGETGQVQMRYCNLYSENGHRLELRPNNPHQPLQRFIREHFHWDELPFKVEIRKELNSDHVEVRYL
jgi:hypothetical protein